jgi:hypothetical protein
MTPDDQMFEETGKTQRHLFRKSEVEDALKAKEKQLPSNARVVTIRGERAVVLEQTVLAFGTAHSGEFFTRRYGLVLGELRQDIGARFAQQVDDVLGMSR